MATVAAVEAECCTTGSPIQTMVEDGEEVRVARVARVVEVAGAATAGLVAGAAVEANVVAGAKAAAVEAGVAVVSAVGTEAGHSVECCARNLA